MASVTLHPDSDTHLTMAAQRLEAVAATVASMVMTTTVAPDIGVMVALLALVDRAITDLRFAGVEL